MPGRDHLAEDQAEMLLSILFEENEQIRGEGSALLERK
jgi:hypothetical protein